MNNKLNNMINEFLANTDAKNQDELNEKLQEFIKKYNEGEIEYQNTKLDIAYELLEKAENSKTKSQAKKLAKQAYEICPECLDALQLLADFEPNILKAIKMLEDGLAKEKERLIKEKYFDKDNIGIFYGIFETRPYIRTLYAKADKLASAGKLRLAVEVCKEILRLNENDNTGARYLLMALYASLEEEKEMIKLYKKYPEENLEMLFPLLALYYKIGDDEKAKEYLKRINKANPFFVKFFKSTLRENSDVPAGYYRKGDASEVNMYFTTYQFLVYTILDIEYFILENSKKTK